jgi:hypothetical protein
MSESSPPVAKPKDKPDLENEIRAKIEKEIAERKSDKASSTQTFDPSKTAVIEEEMRKKIDDEISQRKAEKDKADAEEKAQKADSKDDAKKDDGKSDTDAKKGDAKKEDAKKDPTKEDGKENGDDKAKKKPGDGKKGAAKRKRSKRKIGSQTRPQMTEREQKILEEKAAIDAKLKKRNLYLYAGISGAFLIGLAVLFVLSNRNKNQPAPTGGGTTVKQVEMGGGKGGSTFRASATFKKATEEANALIRSRDYQGAVDYYKAHIEKFPGDAEACEKAIANIDSLYINPAPLPPPDPKAQRSERRWKKKRGPRFDSEGQLIPDDDPGFGDEEGGDEFAPMEDDLDNPFGEAVPATKPAAEPAGDPFDAGLLIDDGGLLDEKPKQEEKKDDPFGDLDNLLE